jgi:hypothetical protein
MTMLARAFFFLWNDQIDHARNAFNLLRHKKVSEALTQIGS